MTDAVLVCSKLPFCYVMEVGDKTVNVAGLNSALIIGATHATTEVDSDFWNDWIDLNEKSALVTSGTIFAAKNTKEAKAISKDSGKTGLEQALPPASSGVTAANNK